MTRRVLVALAISGCSPAMLGQTDDFATAITERCTTEERRAEYETARLSEQAHREEAERARRLKSWLGYAANVCVHDLSTNVCSTPERDLPDDAGAQCRAGCDVEIGRVKERIYTNALRACVDMMIDSLGRQPARCRFLHTSADHPDVQARLDECSAACAEEAKPLIARARAATPRPISPNQGGGGTGTSSGGTRLRCCDGTISPTCACPGHRGCCSHHRGVCGCTN